MTLAEGKLAIEKYRNNHDLYVSIKEPTKTHKEIHDVMLEEFAMFEIDLDEDYQLEMIPASAGL